MSIEYGMFEIEDIGKRWIYNHHSGKFKLARHPHVRRMTNLVRMTLFSTLPDIRRRWPLLVINPATKTVLILVMLA